MSWLLNSDGYIDVVPAESFDLAKNNGNASCPLMTENPINIGTGNKFKIQTDLIGTGAAGLSFQRYYNSLGSSLDVGIGYNWTHTYSGSVLEGINQNGDSIATVRRPNGRSLTYTLSAGSWLADADVRGDLERLEVSGSHTGWRYTTAQDSVEIYDGNGQLQSITDVRGVVQLMTYNAGSGVLDRVESATGEYLIFSYNTDGRIESMTDTSGRVWGYRYKPSGQLKFVVNPDSTRRKYHYEDPDFPDALTGIKDEREIRYATYGYDEYGQAILSTLAGDAERVDINYLENGQRTVTDSRGNQTSYTVNSQLGMAVAADISGPGCTSCGETDSRYEYDTDNNIISITKDGVKSLYGNYDLNGNYQCVVSGVSVDQVSTGDCTYDLNISPQARRTDYIYETLFNSRIKEIKEPSVFSGLQKVTEYNFDVYGNHTSETVNGFDPAGNPVSRTTTYQYNGPLHQLSQIDGPRTDIADITTFHYYPIDHSNFRRRARLKKVEDANGVLIRHTIVYTEAGKIESEKRPNGLSLTYEYFPGNERLKKLTETAADGSTYVTRWWYLETGEAKKISMARSTADETVLNLGYDAARRLTRITDGLGNYIEYKLDTEGNLEEENIHDSSGVLHKSLTQTFDAYNRIKFTYQANEVVDTEFAADGTLDTLTDGKGQVADYDYDDLKRLLSTTQDLGGLNAMTSYDYDAGDRLTEVVDPNNGTTTYQYDDLGNLLSTSSPDTGVTTFTYDDAGNVKTRLDMLGQLSTYSYDALNRLTGVDVAGLTLDDMSYSYDSCSNGVGRLCSASLGTETVSYVYDGLGNVVQHQQVVYDYDEAKRIATMHYPSGNVVTYDYDAAGQVTAVTLTNDSGTTTLASGISYAPFGSVTSLVYGNGATLAQGFDAAYRVTNQQVSGALNLGYPFYDANGNLTERTDTYASDALFNYDGLDRLDDASGAFGTRDYAYDLNGNRSLLDDGAVTTYGYEPSSNRLDNIGSADVILDLAGNTLSKGNWSYTYTAHNRLETAHTNGQLTASFAYNGLGQRVSKTVAGIETRYLYGLDGALLAEIGATGQVRDYIYLNGQLLAVSDTDSSADNPFELIMDNGDPDTVSIGEWITKTRVDDYGANYLRSQNSSVTSKYKWKPSLDPGTYDVYAWWVGNQNNGTAIDYIIRHNGLMDTVLKDQTVGSGGWELLGSYYFNGDPGSERVQVKDSNGRAHADAVKFVRTRADSSIYYVHTDHLGTPQVMTDEAGSEVWRAVYDPFGEAMVDAGSTAELNVRFPGQYFDSETGCHYNYFRYYCPDIGRYLTADPIGLLGGLNTYAYVGSNPLFWVDPSGLVNVNPNTLFGNSGGPANLNQTDLNNYLNQQIKPSEINVSLSDILTQHPITQGAAAAASLIPAVKAAKVCGKVISKNKDKIKKVCKGGILAGSLFCRDAEGNDAMTDVLERSRAIAEVTRRSNVHPPVPKALIK